MKGRGIPFERRRQGALCAAAVAALLASASPASATCGSANCFLVTGTQEGVGTRGALTVDLSFRYVPLDRKLSGSRSAGEVLTPGIDFEGETIELNHHREIETLNELAEIDLSWGVTGRLSLTAALPFLNRKYHEHFDDVGTPDEAFRNTDGTTGFGDVRLGVRDALLVRHRDLLVGGLAIKLPTGAYRLLDSTGAIGEPTLMPGTGSTDLLASLFYSHQFGVTGDWQVFGSGGWRWNGENPLDYRIGDEALLSGGVEHRAGPRVSWSLQANARRTTRDLYRGQSVPSTGATFVNLTPGFRVRSAEGNSAFYLFVPVPVHERVNEEQLAPRVGLMVGISKTY